MTIPGISYIFPFLHQKKSPVSLNPHETLPFNSASTPSPISFLNFKISNTLFPLVSALTTSILDLKFHIHSALFRHLTCTLPLSLIIISVLSHYCPMYPIITFYYSICLRLRNLFRLCCILSNSHSNCLSGKFWASLYILTLASFGVVVLLMYPSLALSNFHQLCIHIASSLITIPYSS